MLSILYTQYFNTAILLLISSVDMFPDTTTNWYILIGPTIVKTMMLLSVFPYINFAFFYAIRLLRRFLDSGWTCCRRRKKSKLSTVQQYVDLYSGPEIEMYFKYSNVLNLTFVALTHGPALPLLFPLALLGIFNNYFVERLCLAYYYKQPPMLDNSLNQQALNTLQQAPLLMLFFAYWYLGNRQMFFNETKPIMTANSEIDESMHSLFDYSDGPN